MDVRIIFQLKESEISDKKYFGPRWKSHSKDFDEKQNEIADLAIEALKNKSKDEIISDGQWLLKFYPEINERYERLLKYFGIL